MARTRIRSVVPGVYSLRPAICLWLHLCCQVNVTRHMSEGRRRPAHGGVVKSGVHAGLSSRRSRVQIPSSPPKVPRRHLSGFQGQVAQSVERCSEKAEVDGSMPSLATKQRASVMPSYRLALALSVRWFFDLYTSVYTQPSATLPSHGGFDGETHNGCRLDVLPRSMADA